MIGKETNSFEDETRSFKVLNNHNDVPQTNHAQALFYQQAWENSPTPLFAIDRKGIICHWNNSSTAAFGHGKEIIGTSLSSLISEFTNKEALNTVIAQVFSGHSFNNIQLAFTTNTKSVKYMVARLYPMFDENRQVSLCFIANTDNTEHLRSVEKVRRLSSAIEQSIDGVAITDLDQRIEYANKRFTQMHGFSDLEIISFPLKRLIAKGFQGTFALACEELVKKGFWTGEIRHCHRDNTPFTTQLSLTLLKDTSNKPSAILVILHDISEQKKMEAQLQEDQKIKAIGTLAGGIAHNFNNLLMGIMGNLSLLLNNMDQNDPNYKRLRTIENCVQQGATLTKQLVAYAKGGKYQTRPSNMNTIIESVATIFGYTKKEIAIVKEYQQDIWTVEVDRSQIEQTLLNLFVNSWQAMPEGGTLLIKTKNCECSEEQVEKYDVSPGNYVGISVSDTGVGMDRDTLNQIFTPFFTTKDSRGTGMGLASVYGTIKNHNGFINVQSEKGKGSCFELFLPATEKMVELQVQAPEQLYRGNKETILIIDDEEEVLEVCSEMLHQMGYSALSATNGYDGVELFKTHKEEISCIVLDIIMPKLGGIKTFHLLRTINPEVKFLVSSGYSKDDHTATLLNDKYCSFIEKPFTMKAFSEKVNQILST